MSEYIDKSFWWRSLGKPDWYLLLAHDFKRLEQLAEKQKNTAQRKQIKRAAYELVEEAIRTKHLPVAEHGPDFDQERRPIDTIVIHHTKNQPGMSLTRLNAMHLLRIYGRYYADPAPHEQLLRGQPIWSGHFYHDQQVFWGYHWLVRQDGTAEQILPNHYIGWHAGNWDINTRSVGICIDDDLSQKMPGETVLAALAALIKTHYSDVSPERVLGHGDINPRTECPGPLFHKIWRQKLLPTPT